MRVSSSPPKGWRKSSCQSNGSVLDVVTHFLWAGPATAWGFEECGKKQCEREERKCVFISVGGAWFFTLICLQTCSWTALPASEAMRSLWRPWKVKQETISGRLVECQQVQGKYPPSQFEEVLIAIVPYLTREVRCPDNVAPHLKVFSCFYPQWQSKDLRRLKDRMDSVQLKWIMTWSFTGETCNKGDDIMGFGLLQSHPSSSHIQILIAKQTTFLFALFIRPKLTD